MTNIVELMTPAMDAKEAPNYPAYLSQEMVREASPPFRAAEILGQTFRDNMSITRLADGIVAVTIGADDVPAPTLLFTPDEFEHAARFFVALSRRPDHLVPLARFFQTEARG